MIDPAHAAGQVLVVSTLVHAWFAGMSGLTSNPGTVLVNPGGLGGMLLGTRERCPETPGYESGGGESARATRQSTWLGTCDIEEGGSATYHLSTVIHPGQCDLCFICLHPDCRYLHHLGGNFPDVRVVSEIWPSLCMLHLPKLAGTSGTLNKGSHLWLHH